jgi:predicted DNA binding protein
VQSTAWRLPWSVRRRDGDATRRRAPRVVTVDGLPTRRYYWLLALAVTTLIYTCDLAGHTMDRSEAERSGAENESASERRLQVLFEVEVGDACSCPLSDPDAAVQDVHKQLSDGTCHAELAVTDDTGTTEIHHSTNQVEESCLCLAFSEVGCVPRIKSAEGGTIVVETFVPRRSVIGELVAALRSVTERVSLRQLTTSRENVAESEPTTVDFSQLTTKQREAATMAVSEGYYETPRQTSMDELATALDISKSALSQRLSGVESKLVTAAFDP